MTDADWLKFMSIKPEFYLKHGRYTRPGKIVSEKVGECKKIIGLEKKLEFITSIIRGLGVFPDSDEKYRLRRARGAEDILASNKLTGCVDYSLILLSMVRELGVPARYVETFRQDFFERPEGEIEGHAFVDLFLDGVWKSYDPPNGFTEGPGYRKFVRREMMEFQYIPVAKGLDFGELYYLVGGEPYGHNFSLENTHGSQDLNARLRDSMEFFRGLTEVKS